MRPESFLESIGSAAIWRGMDRLAGLAKHVLIAAAIGLSAQLDVFYMAIAMLGLLVFSWAGMIDVVSVPNMVRAWREGRNEEFRSIASGMFTLVLSASVVLALVLFVSRGELTVIALGFEADRRELLKDAIPWLLPVILLYVPFRFIGAVLRAQRRFSPFYQAELLVSFIILVCVFFFRFDERVLLWSFSLGVTGAFLYLVVMNRTWIFPLTNPFSPLVRQSIRAAPGLLVLQGAQYVYVLTDRVFVSFLPEGSVSALAYAMTLTGLLPGIISLSGSFITVVAEEKDVARRARRLNELISMIIFIGVGSTVFLLVAGEAMVRVLLERGIFGAADTRTVATAITAYGWMILPMFLIGPLDQIFQVERRLGFMVRRTILGMLINVALCFWFLFGLGWGLFGVALATSISYWVMALSGLNGVAKLGYGVDLRGHLKWSAWVGLGASFTYVTFRFLISPRTDGWATLVTAFFWVAFISLLVGLIYRGEENKLVLHTLRRFLPKGTRT